MASVARVKGDFKPVIYQDADSYTVGAVNAVELGKVVNFTGPKLDFFTVTLTGVGTDTDLAHSTISAVQTVSTIAMYEFVDADTLALAVYPTGAFTSATLADTIGGGAVAAAGATFV